MSETKGHASSSELAAYASCAMLLIGAVLYGWGWSLETGPITDSGYESIEAIERDTAALKARATNIRQQANLLWWGDRAFISGLVAAVAAIILRRKAD